MRRIAFFGLLACAACTACACGTSKLPPSKQFDRDTAEADLATVEKHLGQDPFDLCVSVERAEKTLASEKWAAKLLSDGRRVCGHDAPLAFGQALAKRLGGHGDAGVNECLDLLQVLEKLAPYKTEPEVQALQTTNDAQCK
jgi:hypothetical protein